jgi:hypothetical protein
VSDYEFICRSGNTAWVDVVLVAGVCHAGNTLLPHLTIYGLQQRKLHNRHNIAYNFQEPYVILSKLLPGHLILRLLIRITGVAGSLFSLRHLSCWLLTAFS